MTAEKIHLNLAKNPLRNKRVFIIPLTLLLLLCAGVIFLDGYLFMRAGQGIKETRSAISGMERRIRESEREQERLSSNIEAAAKEKSDEVDLMNSIIFLKTFSWTEFFSRLERALPGSCYIVSLTPKFFPDALLEIEMNTVTPGLDELLVLLNNLESEGFSRIRMLRESRDENGITARIVLSLEAGRKK